MRHSQFTLGLLALLIGSGVSACLPPRQAFQLASVAADVAVTAAIVGSLAAMTYHDPHYHYDACGHHRQWHHGRWVYFYNDQWEYYDRPSATWYFYAN